MSQVEWPDQVAAAIRAGFEFAASNPGAADLLTNQALAHGRDGIARYQRFLAFAAGLLLPGRKHRPDGEPLPEIVEHSVAGGLIMLVAQRVDRGRAGELPELAPDAIQFALTPYLGVEGAQRVAAAQ